MRRVALLGILGALLWAGSAQAHTTIVGPPGSPYQRWVDEAKVPTPNVVATVIPDSARCEGAWACTEPGGLIWLAPLPWMKPPEVRSGLLHEIGHQFDFLMPSWARDRFRALIRDRWEWREGPNAPNEQFAEAWRLCAEYGSRLPVGLLPQGYTYNPTISLQVRVCHLIRIAYAYSG